MLNKEKVIRILARILSYILHPLLLPTWMLLLLLYTNPYSFAGMPIQMLIAMVFINSFMFPAITILLMKKLGFIESLEMPDTKQRIIPMIATIVFYIWAYMAVKKTNFPFMMGVFMMGAVASLLLAFFINVFHKISLHMVGISGVLTSVMLLLLFSQTDVSYLLLLVVVLTGAVASARMYLGAHTLHEVYSGFLVGMFGQIIALFLYH